MANPLLPDALSKHRQFSGNFYTASAFECIAKLHGFIGKDAFPLQSDNQNQNLGFEKNHTQFLSQWCVCKERHFDTLTAMLLIEKETNDGRFPLVSLYEWDEWENHNKPIGWHVFLLLRHGGKLLLVDPRHGGIKAENQTTLAKCLEYNRVKNPERKTLHLFWYELKP